MLSALRSSVWREAKKMQQSHRSRISQIQMQTNKIRRRGACYQTQTELKLAQFRVLCRAQCGPYPHEYISQNVFLSLK